MNSNNNNELRERNLAKIKRKEETASLKNSTKENKLKSQTIKFNKNIKINYAKRKNYIDKKISLVNSKYEKLISDEKLSLEKLSTDPSNDFLIGENIKLKSKSDSKSKHYDNKIAKLEVNINKKEEKIKYNLSIAKISEKVYQEQLSKLEVNKATLMSHLLSSKSQYLHVDMETHLNKNIKDLIGRRDAEIFSLQMRLNTKSRNGILASTKIKLQDFSANYIMGYSIAGLFKSITTHIKKNSMYYILAFIVMIFIGTTSGQNIKAENFATIFQSNIYIIVVSLGMLLVIVAGYIDLSVGAMLAFLGIMSINLTNDMGAIPAIIIVLLMGTLYGLFQGALVGYFKLPPFVVTLGSMLLFKGLSLAYADGGTATLTASFDSTFYKIFMSSFPDTNLGSAIAPFWFVTFILLLGVGVLASISMYISRSKKIQFGLAAENIFVTISKMAMLIAVSSVVGYWLASTRLGLQMYMFYTIILIGIFIFITQHTTFGRNVYAIGGNKRAAELSGIDPKKTTLKIFAITGFMAGVGGMMFVAQAASAASATASQGYELDIISAVFVGGASAYGGIGSIQGTIIGALILGYINNGLLLMQMPIQTIWIIKGIILVSAVAYDIMSNRTSA